MKGQENGAAQPQHNDSNVVVPAMVTAMAKVTMVTMAAAAAVKTTAATAMVGGKTTIN
jgi:hypothetical protein